MANIAYERPPITTMTPPGTQPPSQTNSGNSGGAPVAPTSLGFSPNTTFSGAPISGSSQSPGVPVTLLQLQQLQAAQQQAARQYSAIQSPKTNPAAVPNQFVVSTTTAHAAAAPTMQQASQLQAVAALQQAALAANANVPFLITDPNMFAMQAAAQQNAFLQQQQNAARQAFATMPTPYVQLQQQATVMQQFPVLPQQVNFSGPIQQQALGVNVPLKPHQMQMSSAPQQIASPKVQAPAVMSQPLAPAPTLFQQQALKDPQYQAAVHGMNRTIQTSSNDPLSNLQQQQQVPQVQPQLPLQQVLPKAVGSEDTLKATPNQVFLESNLEPVRREGEEESSVLSAEEDMWKFFFKSSDEDGSNHNSEDQAVTSSIFSLDRNEEPSSPMETSPALQPTDNAASPVASSAETVTEPLNPPALSLQEPLPAKQQGGGSPKIVPARAECGKTKKPSQQQKQRAPFTFEFKGSPQDYLMAILRERGYSTDRIPNNQTSYQTTPSDLELASFGTEVVKAVHAGDVAKLKALMDCGLSPSPCNAFGDYIVHLVCRRADFGILQCLVDHGCNLEVCDSFGRTPLHCVAWAGEFCPESAELILNLGTNEILVEDNRGQCPLEYVRKEQWPQWIDFLRNKMDIYWPIDGKPKLPPSEGIKQERVPEISLELARGVSSGAVSTETVAAMDELTRKYYKQESLKSILFS